MHAYLIIGNDPQEIEKQIDSLAKKTHSTVRHIELKKIADVREFKQLTRLKEATSVLYVVTGLDTATSETSNAFLKLLEEPGSGKLFALVSPTRSQLLPTIVSRTTLITTQKAKASFSNMDTFFTQKEGLQLEKIDSLRKKEDALSFMEEATGYLHEKLVQEPTLENAKKLEVALSTYAAIEKYGVPILHLTAFVIDLRRETAIQ